MPKYDYKCEKCGRIDEITHSMEYSGSIACPDCFKQMKKLISKPAGTHFKGQGWGAVYRNHKPKDNPSR